MCIRQQGAEEQRRRRSPGYAIHRRNLPLLRLKTWLLDPGSTDCFAGQTQTGYALRYRTDMYDRATSLWEMRECVLRCKEYTCKIDIQHAPPTFFISLMDGSTIRNPGTVHEPVNATEGLDDPVYRHLHASYAAHIARDSHSFLRRPSRHRCSGERLFIHIEYSHSRTHDAGKFDGRQSDA